MKPVIDYGGFALVVSKIAAVSQIMAEKARFYFNVYVSSRENPITISFKTEHEALDAREELLDTITQFYYEQVLGPDLDIDEIVDLIDEDNDDKDMGKH